MMGFLSNLGLAAGNNILVGQELQERQENIELKKQQVAMGNLAMQQAQRQAATQQAVGSFLQSEQAKDASNFTDPVKAAGEYQKAAGLALQQGDFASANTMQELAKGKLSEAKEAAATLAQQQQVKKEALANAADDYAANPTAEGAKDMMRKAVDAGVNPSTIPMPGTAQWGTWVNQQSLASKTASQRADFMQKAAEKQQDRELKLQEHSDNVQLREAQMKQTAMLREGMMGIQRQNLQLHQDELELRKKELEDKEKGVIGGGAAGGRVGVQQQRDTAAIAGAAAEGARNLRNITQFKLGTAGSPFQNLSDHGALDAVARMGTNAFTPDQVQMFQTAGAGLATQVGRVETLGGGRGVNQAQINQLEKQLTPVAGDHPLTQLYKVATGAELLKTRMQNTPPPTNPQMKAQWDKTMAELDKYPTPEAILGVADSQQKRELLNFDKSYSSNLDRVRNDVAAHPADEPLPGGADAGAGTSAPPIPSGWSVRAH